MFLAVLAIVVLTLLIAGLTVLISRRKFAATGDADSDSQSFAGGVLNALFTVVLAFYIVFAWQNGDDIETAAEQEANALTDTYWLASAAPQPQAAAIRSATEDYARRVADHEWEALGAGKSDPQVDRLLNELRSKVLALPAQSEELKSAREQALDNIRRIDEGHRSRVAIATDDQSFNVVLLTGSVLGAIMMIAFPLMIGLSLRPANIATMVLLSATLGLTVYLAVELLHPLTGAFAVDPDPFRIALQAMSGSTGT